MPHQEVPFYCANLPREDWPKECPEYLLDLSEKDRGIIGSEQSTFRRLSWPEVTKLISENRLADFKRSPIELRKYRKYIHDVQKEHGSIMNFVLKQRLQWDSTIPKGKPFQYPADDIKILYNDWPYGIDEKIVHLVIWTKFSFEEDPETEQLTWEARIDLEDWVYETFCTRMKPGNVAWFKNWQAISSIHALQHFHVMLYDPDMSFIHEITNGDVPMIAKVSRGDSVAFIADTEEQEDVPDQRVDSLASSLILDVSMKDDTFVAKQRIDSVVDDYHISPTNTKFGSRVIDVAEVDEAY